MAGVHITGKRYGTPPNGAINTSSELVILPFNELFLLKLVTGTASLADSLSKTSVDISSKIKRPLLL